MKKYFLIAFYFITFHSIAQTKFGITGGYNSAELYTHEAPLTVDYYEKTKALSTFKIGVTANINLYKRFMLQPELLLNEKGTNKEAGGDFSGTYWVTNIRLNYLEVPLNIVYKIYNGEHINVFAGGGLYAAAGLWGKEKGVVHSFDSTGLPVLIPINKTIDFKSSDTYNPDKTNVKPFDAGYTVLAGIEFKDIALQTSYSYGLNKIYGNGYRNLSFSISLSYYLKNK